VPQYADIVKEAAERGASEVRQRREEKEPHRRRREEPLR
jgi:hypothetical protein